MARHPEYRDNKFESYIESRRWADTTERRLRQAMERHEPVPTDIVACPVESCGVPVKIEETAEGIRLTCGNCGWHAFVPRGN